MTSTSIQDQSISQTKVDTFRFHGSGSEYFGIWIVNILLTIATLGIYSAWAKVRRNRYFYGNLEFLGSRFDYHARPEQILKGRLLVIALLLALNFVPQYFPAFYLASIVILLVATPSLIALGLRFSAQMTSYRNVRFDFTGKAGGAFLAFSVGPLLSIVSLGLLAPFATRWQAKYVLGNLRYGGRTFSTEPKLSSLYGAFAMSAGIFVFGGIFVMLVLTILLEGASEWRFGIGINPVDGQLNISASWTVIAQIALGLICWVQYRGLARLAIVSTTVFDGKYAFSQVYSVDRYVWIVVSNTVATILSLGLLRAWSSVRYMRFISETTACWYPPDFETILDEIEKTRSATGAEFTDFSGIDIGF